MNTVRWIKIDTNIFDDEKIQLIEAMPSGDTLVTIWFKLLVLAGKCNNNGIFTINDRIAYTDEMLATIFRREISIVRLALETFQQLGMVDVIDDVYTIPNWSKHQSAEQLEKKKEYDREYQRKRREEQKKIVRQSYDASYDESYDALIDNNISSSISSSSSKSKSKSNTKVFVKPTVEEVEEYCLERNNSINAQDFIDYYESQSWKKSNGQKVSDWKACVRTWEHRRKEQEKDKPMSILERIRND